MKWFLLFLLILDGLVNNVFVLSEEYINLHFNLPKEDAKMAEEPVIDKIGTRNSNDYADEDTNRGGFKYDPIPINNRDLGEFLHMVEIKDTISMFETGGQNPTKIEQLIEKDKAKAAILGSIMKDEKTNKPYYNFMKYKVNKAPFFRKMKISGLETETFEQKELNDITWDNITFNIPNGPVGSSNEGSSSNRNMDAPTYWVTLVGELNETLNKLTQYPYDSYPSDWDPEFQNTAQKFADMFLSRENTEKGYIELTQRLMLCKETELVNPFLLKTAAMRAMFKRNDVKKWVLPTMRQMDENDFVIPKEVQRGNNRAYLLNKEESYRVDMETKFSPDKYDTKMNYWREDTHLHIFHSNFHALWGNREMSKLPRYFELFWFSHGQFMKRYWLEMENLGGSVIPLNPQQMHKNLGPGHKPFYFGKTYGDVYRKDDCQLSKGLLEKIETRFKLMREHFKTSKTEEAFGKKLHEAILVGFPYHSAGHVLIGRECSSKGEKQPSMFGQIGPSARDPIFFRWHTHIERMMQQFREKRLPRYEKNDFRLSSKLRAQKVEVELEDVGWKNTLITNWEDHQLRHDNGQKVLSYMRINHKPFKYKIKMINPNRVKKKVMVRLWLAKRENRAFNAKYHPKKGSYKPEKAILMDRFVHTLSGTKKNEEIIRRSLDSALTMKDIPTSMENLWRDHSGKKTETWCGIPHHLLLPRSASSEKGGHTWYQLIAIVTDVDQDVKEGSDGVEHILCWHKDLRFKMDDKHFGFPFDREIAFNIHDKSVRSVAAASVRIIFNPKKPKISDDPESEQRTKTEGTPYKGGPCVTIGGDSTGNPIAGKPCVFPFEYRGKKYLECTRIGEPSPWCSTRTDNKQRHVTGYWGFCPSTPTCGKAFDLGGLKRRGS